MGFYDVGKRILDIVGSIFGIILFSPLLLLTAVWVKIVSPEGPVFADIPLRVGKNGKLFRMYKFRSMIPNAHEYLLKHPQLHKKYMEGNYKIESEKDPRLIKGAIFFRKSSIDEMPQFFNVLIGNMSMVGPRAYFDFEIKEQCMRYPESKPFMERLLQTKPGITGPWQVGGRSEIGWVERVRMDAEYTGRRSLLYDLLIILKTPLVVLKGKGAY